MENQGLPRTLVTGIIGLIFIVLFGSSMFYTIEPGEKGVIFRKFGDGLDKEKIFGQGFHIIAPWMLKFRKLLRRWKFYLKMVCLFK